MFKVIIVDDDVDFGQAIFEAISMLLDQHEFVLCTRASEVVDLVKTTAVDLVITDIIMPEIEGVELISTLKQEDPGLPIIAMSGGGRIGGGNYLTLAKALGADAIFEKPFSLAELSNMIEILLDSEKSETGLELPAGSE